MKNPARISYTSKYHQGQIPKSVLSKYVGGGEVVYRSSYEKTFIMWLEECSGIRSWSYECAPIPYIGTDGKIHRYWPDFFVMTEDGKRYIIEVKPASQKQMPINRRKWEAAKKWASDRGWQFKVVTENTLKRLL